MPVHTFISKRLGMRQTDLYSGFWTSQSYSAKTLFETSILNEQMFISYHLVQGSYSITCSHLDIRKAFSERVFFLKKKKSLLKKEAADLEV